MCLILISINNHPAYKLIVAANRDEFYKRKTLDLESWSDHPQVIGGRDLEASGTWMAVTRSGKVSMVTNYRDLSNIRPNAPSRGKLVSDFLVGTNSPEEYLKAIEPNAAAYNGFNLLVGNQDRLYYLSNYRKGISPLDRGFFALSNHVLDTPWPKIVRGRQRIVPVLRNSVIDPEALLDALFDQTIAADKDLPDTGVGLERERALSAMFIRMENYGTRCSTVLMIDKDNNVTIAERVYEPADLSHREKKIQFRIAADL